MINPIVEDTEVFYKEYESFELADLELELNQLENHPQSETDVNLINRIEILKELREQRLYERESGKSTRKKMLKWWLFLTVLLVILLILGFIGGLFN